MGIDGVEYYGQMSFMKGGIFFLDCVMMVSLCYVCEIQIVEFGCGLDGVVVMWVDDIVGLINGIDVLVWNLVSDEYLMV